MITDRSTITPDMLLPPAKVVITMTWNPVEGAIGHKSNVSKKRKVRRNLTLGIFKRSAVPKAATIYFNKRKKQKRARCK